MTNDIGSVRSSRQAIEIAPDKNAMSSDGSKAPTPAAPSPTYGALGELGEMSRGARSAPGNPSLRNSLPTAKIAPVLVDGKFVRTTKDDTVDPAKTRPEVANLKQAIIQLRADTAADRDAAERAPVKMKINLNTFRENYRSLRSLVNPNTEMSIVLKADAYGVGAGKLAKTLEQEGCNKFFVATLDEAIKMRKELKPESTVLVLGGPLEGTAWQFLDHNVTPVLNSLQQVEEWNELGKEKGRKLPAILQFDTGMSRAGIAPEDRAKVKHGSEALANIDVKYVMSHLATAGEATLAEDGTTRRPSESMEKQHEVFKQIMAEYPGIGGSLAASSALHIPEYQHEMVRGGGAVHGQELFDDGKGTYKQPVTVTGRLAEVRPMKEGDGIGYGMVYRANEPRIAATIPAGYADGLPRAMGSSVTPDGKNQINGYVMVNGERAPIIGKMSMDMTTIDLSYLLTGRKIEADGSATNTGKDPDLRLLEPGAHVQISFVDDKQTFDDVARQAGTNSSMVSIGIGNSPRVNKQYVDFAPPAQESVVPANRRRQVEHEPIDWDNVDVPNTEPLPGSST